MKSIIFFYIILIALLFAGCKTIVIQGEKISASDICGECNPGNLGQYMIMTEKTFDPQINELSTPKQIASEILGYVFPENDRSGSKKFPCSCNSTKSPFSIDKVKSLGSTGSDGTTIEYSKKDTLKIDIDVTIKSDLDSIKASNPNLSTNKLNEFKARLKAAYTKFAGKELTITGKYFQFALDENAIYAMAKGIDYTDCTEYMRTPIDGQTKRMITAIGLVYFDIKSKENRIDEVAAELKAEANVIGISYNIGTEFKRNISKELKKSTLNYYQIVAWRTIGVKELDLIK